MRIKQSDIVLRTPSCTITLLLLTINLPQFILMFLDHPCDPTLLLTKTSTGSFVIFSNNMESIKAFYLPQLRHNRIALKEY
jgi:hypothetical protein